jgi:3D (Asp-Asp-Asp) domain-containing protein
VSVLSLSLLLPFGAGAFPDRAITFLTDFAGRAPAKNVVLIDGSSRIVVQTRSSTVASFLAERGITPGPDDRLSSGPETSIYDGETIAYRAAVPALLVVDGVRRPLHTAAANVGEALAAEHLVLDAHDTVVPARSTPIGSDALIQVTRATSWLEHVRSLIPPPLTRKYDLMLPAGTQRVVDPGHPGTRETTVAVLQPNRSAVAQRQVLAARILRFPRAKVVAEGVGDYTALAGIAQRGMAGTVRLADAALKMVATAYTGACAGCSGMTASGHPAGRGIVAVDPHFIPLGTHLFIPGYGHAFAGDTGGAIRGNRIDLGFDSHRDALTFGRRRVVVYVLR